MNANTIVEVKDLHVSFPLEKGEILNAVKGVSFQIAEGETLVLVGESGSGKSVTAMTILRLTEHDSAIIDGGKIDLRLRNGETVDVLSLPLGEMNDIRGADVSIVFQDPMSSLNPVFKIGDQISEAIVRHQKWDIAPTVQSMSMTQPKRRNISVPHSTASSGKSGLK